MKPTDCLLAVHVTSTDINITMTTSTLSSITISWSPRVEKETHCLSVVQVHISYTPLANCQWAKDRFNTSFEEDFCVGNSTRTITVTSASYQSVYKIDELAQNISYVVDLEIILPYCNETILRGSGVFKTLLLGILLFQRIRRVQID